MFWLALIVLIVPLSAQMDVANSVLGFPTVVCNEDGVTFELETHLPFEGQLYVKNEFDNNKCRANFGSNFRFHDSSTKGSFRLKFTQCSVRRQRMVTPDRGMAYMVTMMVQFHQTFVTANDRAYEVRCFYKEQTTNVRSNDISVNPLEPQRMEYEYPMPKCTYEIRKSDINGPVASLVHIGDSVMHIFKCNRGRNCQNSVLSWSVLILLYAYFFATSDEDAYRMLVKDCFVDDGKDNTKQLIQTDGCSVDQQIFQTPQYTERTLEAFAESHVFKWPDQSSIFFSCQLTLCMNDDEQCRETTVIMKDCVHTIVFTFCMLAPKLCAIEEDEKTSTSSQMASNRASDNKTSTLPITDVDVETSVLYGTNTSLASSDPMISADSHLSRLVLLNEKSCYGPEYAVGFAALLSLICLSLVVLSLRLCCPFLCKIFGQFYWLSKSESSISDDDPIYASIYPPIINMGTDFRLAYR